MLAGSPSINNESIAENTAVFNAADIFEPGEYVRGRDASSRRGLVTVALYGRSELRTYWFIHCNQDVVANFPQRLY